MAAKKSKIVADKFVEDFLEEDAKDCNLSDAAFRQALKVEKTASVKMTSLISHDLYVKLATAAAMEGSSQSFIVERALKKELDGLTVIDTRYRKKS